MLLIYKWKWQWGRMTFFLRRESTYRILPSRVVSKSNSYKGLLIENIRWLLSEMEHVLNIWMFLIQNCLSFLPAAMIKYSNKGNL